MKKEPMKVTEIAAKPKEQKILRVAAYARVSTDKDAAFHSLEAQKDYYEKYVSRHPDWKLVAVYSDNGISGTTINRPAFQEMLEDCRNGKIDLIITKSVSRFARNVVILLETMRELKALGIDIFFEKDNMHSISPDGELLLTLIAMYAEEEARSVSENQKWRVQKIFEKGEPWTAMMLGYKIENRQMVVVPEEAEIVRQIYADYLSGMSVPAISKKLLNAGIITRYISKWSHTAISGILSNEKYVGDMLLQKYYVPDFRTKVSKRNEDERDKYLVRNSHEAIIDRETFEQVQEEKARRKEERAEHYKRRKFPFTKMLVCGFCGRHFTRSDRSHVKPGYVLWICNGRKYHGKDFCPARSVPESVLIEKTEEILGTAPLTRGLFLQKIKYIEVPEHNHLRYFMADGSIEDVFWKNVPRGRKKKGKEEL